jgi:hypothetical protein
MTWLSLTIRGHRTSEQRRCHEESQKLLHSSEPIWTPHLYFQIVRQFCPVDKFTNISTLTFPFLAFGLY